MPEQRDGWTGRKNRQKRMEHLGSPPSLRRCRRLRPGQDCFYLHQCRSAALNSNQGRGRTRGTKEAPSPALSPTAPATWQRPNFRTLNSSRLRHFDPCPHAATASLDFTASSQRARWPTLPPAFPTSNAGATKGHPGSVCHRGNGMRWRRGTADDDGTRPGSDAPGVAPGCVFFGPIRGPLPRLIATAFNHELAKL